MADFVEFTDNSAKVKAQIKEASTAFLFEVGELIKGAAADASPVDSSQLRGSWGYRVSKDTVTIGSPLENAIWNEFGTGEHAANKDGRIGGWYIPAEKLSAKAKTKMQMREGKNGEIFYFTRGKMPQHTLQKVIDFYKNAIKKKAEQIFSGLGDDK